MAPRDVPSQRVIRVQTSSAVVALYRPANAVYRQLQRDKSAGVRVNGTGVALAKTSDGQPDLIDQVVDDLLAQGESGRAVSSAAIERGERNLTLDP